ncbi:MAG TPA: S8 family serine peptidase, partial [Actinomycetota bacterium]|nr:S8 family serine peptidase [Actinomycetota bacterium]
VIPNPPNDSYFASQWALKVIKAPQAWTTTTGAGITVAVVDTGVQFGIADLPASKSAGAYDCRGYGGKPDPCPADASGDGQGHGTWVASIIAAATNNGQGMAGVAPDAKILAIKAIGGDGTGSVDDISKGIKFAADQGAKVINLSVGPDAFGKPFPKLDCPVVTVGGCLTPPVNDSGSLHKALQPAVDYASGRGALVVVAAGNTDPGATPGPSLYLGMNNVLIVGATGPQDEVASYSDTGSGATFIWAPGGDGTCSSGDTSNCVVIASMNGGYQVSEGTSFAVPHVAGVAALLMATGSSNSAAAKRIVASGDQVAAGARLNAAAALGVSSGSPALPARPPAAPPVRAAPAPVVAKPAVKATPTPASTPTPTPTPTPSPTPTSEASPLAAAGISSQKAAGGATGRPASSTASTQMVAFVLFLASAGGASIVWIARRVRV